MIALYGKLSQGPRKELKIKVLSSFALSTISWVENNQVIAIWASKICLKVGQLDKQGFQKHDTVREWETRQKNPEKSKDQGINTAPRWRGQNWIQASFTILPVMNEKICRKLNYNLCGLQGQRTKWSLTIE